jgi:hypothetical protein
VESQPQRRLDQRGTGVGHDERDGSDRVRSEQRRYGAFGQRVFYASGLQRIELWTDRECESVRTRVVYAESHAAAGRTPQWSLRGHSDGPQRVLLLDYAAPGNRSLSPGDIRQRCDGPAPGNADECPGRRKYL